jgi:hypothetical protein
MCFHRPLAKQTDLELAHGALEAKQKTIVEQAGIIDAVVVDDQGAGHRAEIDQMVPVAVVAGQTRSFEC